MMRALQRLLSEIRLRTSVYRYAMRVLDELGHAPLMDPLSHVGIRTTAVGLDPIRVLVFGAGLAVGYGVTRRADSFDGPLVDHLATATGRGITLENRAVQHLGTPAAAASLGLSGTHTFHLAIWSPSFAEGLRRLSLTAWRRDLAAMIEDLQSDSAVPLLLLHMPEPAGLHPAAVLARPRVHRINRAINRAAGDYAHVTAVATVPFVAREIGQPVTSPAYFADVAACITPLALAALHLPPRHLSTDDENVCAMLAG